MTAASQIRGQSAGTGRGSRPTLATVLEALTAIADLPAPLAVRESARIVPALARDRAFQERLVQPLLARVPPGEPSIPVQYAGADGAYSLQIFVWPPGAQTPIHDHSCWGLYTCLHGVLQERRYVRLDDGSRANQAHLRLAWQRAWQPTDGASTVLPYAGGIHQVSNPGVQPVVSVHVYGRPGAVDGRDYDPRYNFVCDRPPEAAGEQTLSSLLDRLLG